MDGFDLNIPPIAEGRVIPYGVQKEIDERERLEEEKREAERRAESAMDNERRSQNIAVMSLIVGISSLLVALVSLAVAILK